jgi:translation initiation factor 1
VTVFADFVGIGLPEKESLAKAMQNACRTGGTVEAGRIEIRGDKRTEFAHILTEAGFRPVFAGGQDLENHGNLPDDERHRT